MKIKILKSTVADDRFVKAGSIEEINMKIKILKSTVADDRFVKAGSIEEISDRDAMLLIRMGKAVAVDALPPAPTIMTTDNVSGAIAEDKPRRGRPARFGNAGK